LFCEKLLVEQDNVNSVIRIVDTINITPLPGQKLKRGGLMPLPLALLLMVKAGDARGKREMQLRLVSPSGKVFKTVAELEFNLSDPPEGGANFKASPVLLKWDKEGLYWFEFLLEGKLFARVPLRVNVVKPDTQAQTPAT
jgi:hypothetical protein